MLSNILWIQWHYEYTLSKVQLLKSSLVYFFINMGNSSNVGGMDKMAHVTVLFGDVQELWSE